MARKRLFTGLQPSGTLHIGNYFGALKLFLDLYEDYESFLCAVDYHALTTVRDPKLMHENTIDIVRDYLAVGVDPRKAVIFKQSDVSEHTELSWIFNAIIPMSLLELGHAYKDTAGKGKEATVGLFTYPTLMAADIVLYDTDVVPVGEDQRQHIEYAREIAHKFNTTFGETFKEPKEMIQKDVAVVPGTDGRKMSKSYGNTIPLFATKDEITKAVMAIITDSGGESPSNVYNIHLLFKSREELAPVYTANKGNYKASKEALIADIEAFVAPIRERRANISDETVIRVLKEGSEKARELASAKMKDVRQKIGVSFND
ncbi:MAG: tryptophan--tRNA ligase [Candidatus Pacebacteria bacterium]|nr:tryptophan--tRNA ligase [Candidatus Paceibacterota bacterium]